MSGFDKHDAADILRFARTFVGRTLGELSAGDHGIQNVQSRGKVGALYEACFGIAANSDHRPDFHEAGVELKSVPLKRNAKGGWTPKERTTITMIDYAKIHTEPFEGSRLDLKTRHTLFIFYEHLPAPAGIGDFRTRAVLLLERDELETMIAREAYEHVARYVRDGRAHELSEAQTIGIGAATKDSRAKDVAQPASSVPARRRAFAYRPTFTARLLAIAEGKASAEPLPAPTEIERFIGDVDERLDVHRGQTLGTLKTQYAPEISPRAKNVASRVSRELLGGRSGRIPKSFERLGINIRTVRVDPGTWRPHEATSFTAIDFVGLPSEEFETSTFANETQGIFFVVFSGPKSGALDSRLVGGLLWTPSGHELRVMEREWTSGREAVRASRPSGFPQQGQTEIVHMRPHGRNKADTRPLPNGVHHVKTSFWLNQDFVQRLILQRFGAPQPRDGG